MIAVPSSYVERHRSIRSAVSPARRLGAVVGTQPHDGGGHQYALTLVDALASICDGDPHLDVAVYAEGRAEDTSPPPFGEAPIHRIVPATGAASLVLSLPEAADVHVAVYDVLGREVAVLADGQMAAGEATVRVATGTLPAGTYVVRAAVGMQVLTQRLTVTR